MENILCVQILSVPSLGSVTIAIHFLGNNNVRAGFLFFGNYLSSFINITDVRKFQALWDVCASVRDWETLTESIQIPEVIVPMPYARLTDLTIEEIEVRFIFHWLVSAFHSI